MSNVITLKLTPRQEEKLFAAFADTKTSAPAYAKWQLRPENCVITCYESGKTVFQGKDAAVYAAPFSSAAPEASVETLLVLDGMTGQNAIEQARAFAETADVSGIIVTKLDGTAKGGSVFSVREKLGIPVRFVGVGEGIDDLLVFDPDEFCEALFE